MAMPGQVERENTVIGYAAQIGPKVNRPRREAE
jgi:hypothetical protein